ncbi:MAG: nitrile hydratase subunit beta [Rhodospirillaceae bacterium]|nr:nitrile hydratase subunit beta [Rhodospirillaceae bacterium]
MSWGEGIAARFRPGDAVRVAARFPTHGHIRTPFYIRGKTGIVERICGRFSNPEELAFGKSGKPEKVLYRVRFDQVAVWPDYRGNPNDKVEVEIFEHWLDPAP